MSELSSLPAPAHRATWRDYLLAIAACGLTTALTIPLHDWLELVNTVMLFLLVVVVIAARLGRGPAVLASFLSVGLFDFFYVPPRWSFAVSDVQYVLTFAVMLIVALIISHLTIGLRVRAQEAQQAAERSNALYALASQLAGALTIEQVCDATEQFAQQQLAARARLLLPAAHQARDSDVHEPLLPARPDQAPLDSTLTLLAQAAFQVPRNHSTQQLGDDGHLHALLPLAGSTRSRGVLILSSRRTGARELDGHRSLLDALATLVATALERLHFVNVAHQTQLEMNDERLRGSILSALSHDIRTPLTSLFGLADTLTLMQPPLPGQAKDMASAIRDQAMRLHRMVSNLLDMARLQTGQQAGQLPLRLEWQPIEEVIGASIQLLGHSLDDHPVKVHLREPGDAELPLLSIDAVLMERVFGNLLENAAKYSPAHTDIHISAEPQGTNMLISVRNEGAGFPADRLPTIFGVFERGTPESSIPGVGLGLSICQAIVEAHGGRIEALNPPEGGAEVRFMLPLGTPPTIEPEPESTANQEGQP